MMPELPEVETIRASLEPHLVGAEIKSVEVLNPVVITGGSQEAFQELAGAVFTAARRRGKYLLFDLKTSDGQDKVLVAHMRMTGRLLWHSAKQPLEKHSHLRFNFQNGAELVFVDVRRFGRLWLVALEEIHTVSGLNTLAPEPMDEDFSVEVWERNIANRKKSLAKGVLLDQRAVAGLGNIYADEVLFAAKVHPERRVETLSHRDNMNLCRAMQAILQEAIRLRGTSFRDYVDSDNRRGGYLDMLQCFMREGQPCPRCGTPIKRIKVVGRSSYYCPRCQRRKSKAAKKA